MSNSPGQKSKLSKLQLAGGEDNELSYIYAVLRKLGQPDSKQQTDDYAINILDFNVFNKKFLFKLIEERLLGLSELAEKLATNLLKRLANKEVDQTTTNANEQQDFSLELKASSSSSSILTTRCFELDEYFHSSLYYLHDFIIELNWHETNTLSLTGSELEYVETNLKHVRDFILFQKKFVNIDQQNMMKNLNQSYQKRILSQSPIGTLFVSKVSSSTKSNLSHGSSSQASRLNSPFQKRRIRFRDTSPEETISDKVLKKDLRDSNSIFALDLLIYSINLFIQNLCNRLVEWLAESSTNLQKSLIKLKESKQKIRIAQLESISLELKSINNVYLSVLEHLIVLRRIYLSDFLLRILSANDSERILNLFKRPRIRTFNERICLDVERKLIIRLAKQCLQLMLDLIISEINIPPLELNAGTKTKSKEELTKSRNNYFNFISSWLNIDDVVFGFLNPDNGVKQNNVQKVSTLAHATGSPFKSSSRILAQMDNLEMLMSNLTNDISQRLQSNQQLKFFLDLLQVGLNDSFETTSKLLIDQLSTTKTDTTKQLSSDDNKAEQQQQEVELIKNVDLIAAKIRCLKFIHIMSAIDKLVREIAHKKGIELNELLNLEKRLQQFTDNCTQQTGSMYIS